MVNDFSLLTFVLFLIYSAERNKKIYAMKIVFMIVIMTIVSGAFAQKDTLVPDVFLFEQIKTHNKISDGCLLKKKAFQKNTVAIGVVTHRFYGVGPRVIYMGPINLWMSALYIQVNSLLGTNNPSLGCSCGIYIKF